MVFITVTCLVSCDCDQTTVRSYVTRRISQAHPRLLPEGYRATSPRALAGGHRPTRSVASIAHLLMGRYKGQPRDRRPRIDLYPLHPPRTGAQVRCRARRPLPAGGE